MTDCQSDNKQHTPLTPDDSKNEPEDDLDLSIGDTVVVTIHTHKKETGTVIHITKDNSIFITPTKSNANRVRVVAANIRKRIQIVEKATESEDTNKKTLSPTEIQYYVTQITDSTGYNYQRIGRNYETGLNRFPINFNKAMSWYKSGHKLQNIHCTVELANISSDYYDNYDEAERYWNIGIDGGYKHCAFAANVMFRRVPNGKHKELYYIRKYVELTNGTDVGGLLSFAVCQLTMDIPDYSEAYKYLMKAYNLNRNSIGVQQFLAFTVYRGLGCIKNQNKAIEMHKNLSKSKNSECSMLWMAVYNARNEKINNINNIHPLRNKIYNSFINVINNGDSHGLYYGNWLKINKYHAIQKKNIMSSCLFISFTIFGILQCPINIKHAKKCVENIFHSQNKNKKRNTKENNKRQQLNKSRKNSSKKRGKNKQGYNKNKNKKVQQKKCKDPWMLSWLWFYTKRYNIINSVSGLQTGLIDLITAFELSIFISEKDKLQQ